MMTRLRSTTDKEEAQAQARNLKAYLDRLVHKRIIHKNKAANYKSALDKSVNAL
jgi:small subunit ribosomal protein S20